MANKRITVIGGGPGGYVAAIRAAQLGADVTLIEKKALGGTCLNNGCMPTKSLLESAHIYYDAGHSAELGVEAAPALNWDAVQQRRGAVISALVGGVAGLLRANKVKVVTGTAAFTGKNTLNVTAPDGTVSVESADAFILAAGSVPSMPPIEGVDSDFCIDSTAALSLEKRPASMVIVGGGVIGIELASAYSRFGTAVTILEMADSILPGMDAELTARLAGDMESQGVRICTGAKVKRFGSDAEGPFCSVETPAGSENIHAEKMLICAGRKPDLTGLGLEKAGVRYDKVVETDEHLKTSAANIYAIGDCNGRLMLASAASAQGAIAAENCMGMDKVFRAELCPSTVFSIPELASVGITEKEAAKRGIACTVGSFPTVANGRSLVMRQTTGLVKIVAGAKDGEILGVHIYAGGANELIAQCAMAMELEATSDELADMVFGHPTVSECLHEAALSSQGRAVHMPNRKR